MKRLLSVIYILLLSVGTTAYSQRIVSGIPWFDQEGKPVNAHGGSIVYEDGRWWLFGEWKTDTSNAFAGFSCYSSTDLAKWHFERMALSVQPSGILGPERGGERPKVMRCPKTGKYVMFMHTDNLDYNDQRTAIATSDYISGPYVLIGPLLYNGKEMHHWDIGTFQDSDGTAYLLADHGTIYRLADDYLSAEAVVSKVEGAGESPVLFRHGDTYFYLTSNLTSWERNDNYYFTAPSVSGPWTRKVEFCPKGSLTYNSQCTFVAPIPMEDEDTVWMYLGDRWSYPRQGSAATYVWQPISIYETTLSIPEFHVAWTPDGINMEKYLPNCLHQAHYTEDELLFYKWKQKRVDFRAKTANERYVKTFKGQQVAFTGYTSPHGGYARVSILNKDGRDTLHTTIIDCYSLKPANGIRYISPKLPKGKYQFVVEPTGDGPVWYDKRRNRFGSDACEVDISCLYINP